MNRGHVIVFHIRVTGFRRIIAMVLNIRYSQNSEHLVRASIGLIKKVDGRGREGGLYGSTRKKEE